MAVKTDLTIAPIADTNAHFQAWASFIDSVFLLASCWVDTAAVGSINLATVAAPAALNTSQGFKVYRMNDTLQATAPVFIKIEYGSGPAASTPGIWFTIGQTHDGSGNLGLILQARTQHANLSSGASADRFMGSASTNRITLALSVNTSSNTCLWFSLERSKDATGADTAEALILAYGKGTTVHASQWLALSGTSPTLTVGLQCLLPNDTTSSWRGFVAVSAMYPMAIAAQQPGENIILVRAGDFNNYDLVNVTIYAGTHAYQHCGPNITTLKAGAGLLIDTNVRLCLRYE